MQLDEEPYYEALELISNNLNTNSNKNVERKRTKSGIQSSDIENEFACPVCLRLVIQPTTLNCGHTSCRACLAQWYFNSKKKECPLCRLEYKGHPMINTQLKNLIELHCQDIIEERDPEEEKDNEELVRKYDEELSGETSGDASKSSDVTSFCSGILVALGVVVIAYLAWYWQTSDANLLVKKPVQTWKPRDVATWMSELGWAKTYALAVSEEQIDGNLLLSLDLDSMEQRLNMTDTSHQRALTFAIRMLQEQGLKMPASLWEYKAIYPGRSLFLVYSLQNFPRTSLLYLYFYFHDEMFMPFVRATSTTEDEDMFMNSTEEGFPIVPDVEPMEWANFLFHTVFTPQWLVAVFAYQMFNHHFITPLFVLATAALYTQLEVLSWLLCFQDIKMFVPPILKGYLKQLMSAFMFMVMWPVLPSLVCDILFYGALYISPIHAITEVVNRVRELVNHV